MHNIKEFFKVNKHFLYLLIFIPLLLIFFICEKFISPEYVMHSKLDDYIPFVKFFIIPYLFWFVYIAMGFVYFGLKSKEDFMKLAKFIFLGMGISYAIFILFPNEQNMRPVIRDNDIISKMVKFIYSIDSSENVFPSIHVLNAIAVNSVIHNSKLYIENRKIKILSSIAMVLICASTVFLKQHSIIDVFGGAILAGIIYLFIYFIPKTSKRRYMKKIQEEITLK